MEVEIEAKQATNWVCLIAAALGAKGLPSPECESAQVRAESIEVVADFAAKAERTEEGYLRTSRDYAIRVDEVRLDPSRLGALEPLEGVSAARERRVLVGVGATMRGRVFDLGDARRLPIEGVEITGSLPLEIAVRETKRLDLWRPNQGSTESEVSFELPASYFDEIEWSALAPSA